MRQNLVTALAETHGITIEHADALLGEFKQRRSVLERRPIMVEELYALIEIALDLRKNLPADAVRPRPTITELADATHMILADMDNLIRSKSIPQDLRILITSEHAKTHPKNKGKKRM